IRGLAGCGEILGLSGSELHAPIESPVGSIRIFPMNAFIAIVLASLLSRLGYQMARSPVLPIFAADLGALPELIGVIVAASTITGVFFKLPSGALSDVLGRKRMMVLGAVFFAAPPFLYPLIHDPWRCWRYVSYMASLPRSSHPSPRLTLRVSARPGGALGSAGSRRQTTSVQLRGRSSAASCFISPPAIR